MKKLKFFLFLCITATILSCSSDSSGGITFTLSNSNIAGTYNISSFQGEEKETAISGNTVVTISTTTLVGDTFQLDFIINANGTYTAVGELRIVETITPNGGAPVIESEIINFDAAGTYLINNSNNTITFTPTSGDFLSGIFNVVTFTENSVSLTKEDDDIDGGITTTYKNSFTFSRK